MEIEAVGVGTREALPSRWNRVLLPEVAVTWRGKSAFSKELNKRGVRQIVAAPRRPQTLGKIERFWGSLWPECVEKAIFLDLEDARRRIGLYIDYYNFQRPHQVILETVAGTRTVEDAAKELGMSTTYFHELRKRALTSAAHSLEPQPLGRPPEPRSAEAEMTQALRKRLEQTEIELEASRIREELALTMPHVLARPQKKSLLDKVSLSRRRKKS